MVEIMDIQDELNIVLTLLTQQKDVLDHLARLFPSFSLDQEETRLTNDDEATFKQFPRVKPSAIVRNVRFQSENQSRGQEGDRTRNEEHVDEQVDGRSETHETVRSTRCQNCTASLTEIQVTESNISTGASETSTLKNRAFLQESLDIVTGNIKSVNHISEHAGKVHGEVQIQKCSWRRKITNAAFKSLTTFST